MREFITAQKDGDLETVSVQIAEVVHAYRDAKSYEAKEEIKSFIDTQGNICFSPTNCKGVAQRLAKFHACVLPHTSNDRLPAGTVDDALAACDVICVTGTAVVLRHGEVTVSVRHGHPAEQVFVGGLAQGALVLSLDPGPRLFIHLVILQNRLVSSVVGPGRTLHVKGVDDNLFSALQISPQNKRRPLHPRDDGFGFNSHLDLIIQFMFTCFVTLFS